MAHLSPEELAGYLDNDLPRNEKGPVELHLASCGECRTELAEIRRLQRQRLRRQRLPVLVPLAAAAVLALAIVIPRQDTSPSEIRSGGRGDESLGIVSPAPSAETASGRISFIWRSAGPGASYTITLQEHDGRPVWTSSLTDTVTVLPDSIVLVPGRTWYWTVDALLPNGRSVSTGAQPLKTRP